MNELIKTIETERDEILVSGRDLHEFVESNERYSKWFERMITYGFERDIDFTGGQKSTAVNNGRVMTLEDHQLTIDMAKEISMIQRNEKGKQARRYFIELERRWNSPEMIMKRAYDIINKKLETTKLDNLVLTQQVNELQPKASYYDAILQNKSLLSVSKIAKDYGMSATALNRILNEMGVQYKQGDIWLLYAKYQDKGYTQTSTYMIDAEKSKILTKWTQKGRLFLYELLKGEDIIPKIEQEWLNCGKH